LLRLKHQPIGDLNLEPILTPLLAGVSDAKTKRLGINNQRASQTAALQAAYAASGGESDPKKLTL
jgi:hypothetical protein